MVQSKGYYLFEEVVLKNHIFERETQIKMKKIEGSVHVHRLLCSVLLPICSPNSGKNVSYAYKKVIITRRVRFGAPELDENLGSAVVDLGICIFV